jgi:hypothetical protein
MNNILQLIASSTDKINLSFDHVIILICLPPILTALIFFFYMITLNKKKKTFKGFHATLTLSLLLSTSIALIMLAVGNNLARAFALVGVFTILRFRNTNKTMYPLIFILTAIINGITCGVGLYLLSIYFTLFTCTIIGITNTLYRFSGKNEDSGKQVEPNLNDNNE